MWAAAAGTTCGARAQAAAGGGRGDVGTYFYRCCCCCDCCFVQACVGTMMLWSAAKRIHRVHLEGCARGRFKHTHAPASWFLAFLFFAPLMRSRYQRIQPCCPLFRHTQGRKAVGVVVELMLGQRDGMFLQPSSTQPLQHMHHTPLCTPHGAVADVDALVARFDHHHCLRLAIF